MSPQILRKLSVVFDAMFEFTLTSESNYVNFTINEISF